MLLPILCIVCSPGPSGSDFIDEIFYRCDNNRWPCVLECLVFDVPVNMKCGHLLSHALPPGWAEGGRSAPGPGSLSRGCSE